MNFLPTLLFLVGAASVLQADDHAAVDPAITPAARPFPLKDVRLLEGPFKQAMELDGRYMLSLEPDRLLHTFRLTAGLPSDAEPLGGWEAPNCGLRGHFTGHYLSGCARMYECTSDPRYRENAEKVIAGMAECQKALGNGYLSAFPASAFDTLETKYGKVWAPYYTIHKIMAGLLDCYEAFGDKQALGIAQGMADYFSGRMAKLTPDQIKKVLQTKPPENEFGGMSDILHRLYAITGRPSDLRLADQFDRPWIVDQMAGGNDILKGLHANTHIPQALGWWQHYLTTGEAKYREATRYFWQQVARHRSYVEGGDSHHEHFFALDQEAAQLGPTTSETCNVYNMLKLTGELFQASPDAELGDYYEKALYNHILGSIDPETGTTIYFLSLQPGGFKVYATPLDSFWCCNGTGLENHALYGAGIYYQADAKLWVNLYIASELDWKKQGVTVRQETAFPAEQGSSLKFGMTEPKEFEVNLRIPSWATNGVSVSLNGQRLGDSLRPGSFYPIRRTWTNGDTLRIDLPMSLRTYHASDDPKTVAILYGPVVLAGELGRESYPGSDHAKGQLDLSKLPVPVLPALVGVDPDKPAAWLQPIPGKPLSFLSGTSTRPEHVVFTPLYSIHHQRYSVYWKSCTESEWQDAKLKAVSPKASPSSTASPSPMQSPSPQ
jgi:DUF1680 family protein